MSKVNKSSARQGWCDKCGKYRVVRRVCYKDGMAGPRVCAKCKQKMKKQLKGG